MSLSKKHFIAIAKIMRANASAPADTGAGWELPPGTHVPTHTETCRTIASELADYFAGENPNFDRARFIEACQPAGRN